MSKTFTAPFAQTPRTATAVVTAGVTNLTTDSPTGTVLLMTAGADGSILTRLTVMPRATASASSLLLFISNDNGVTQRLIDSESMPLQNFAVGTGIAETTFSNYSETRPMRLAAGDKLYAGSQVAAATGLVFKAEYTDF